MVLVEQRETLGKLSDAFTPHHPIHLPEFLAGRSKLLYRVTDAANTEGLHVILFGDRGTGKTSIVRILGYQLQEPKRVDGRRVVSISCSTNDDYSTIWGKIAQEILMAQRQMGFVQHSAAVVTGRLDVQDTVTDPNAARFFVQSLPNPCVIVIDEFDRVSADGDARRLMADTIKLFADSMVTPTLIIVGVGDSIDELIREHESISRNIAQIRVDPMPEEELAEIISTGYEYAGLTFAEGLDARIARLSQGYPHYTHLLGLWAGRRAVDERATDVSFEHLEHAIPDALENAEGGLQHQYERAVVSSVKNALFKDALLACARAEKDALGRFPVGALQSPLENITGRRYATGAYQGHLAKFCEDDRGSVLVRSGKKKLYRWRFVNPQLIPYVLLQGISDNRIKSTDFA